MNTQNENPNYVTEKTTAITQKLFARYANLSAAAPIAEYYTFAATAAASPTPYTSRAN